MRFLLLTGALVLAASSCKKDPPTPAAVAQPSDTVHGKQAETSKPECKLDGFYRFRFESNGQKGLWFRVEVSGAKAKLLEDVDVLALKAGPLVQTTDPTNCELTLAAQSRTVGDLKIAVKQDAKTNTFTGRLARTKATLEKDKNIVISGVFDDGPPRDAAACVVPGIYKIVLDTKPKWKPEEEGDDRDCSGAADYASPMFIRLEPFGKELAVTFRKLDPPYGEAWATDSQIRHGDCELSVNLKDESTRLEARLGLAADRITGVASRASYEIVEDGPEGDGIWTCVGTKVRLTGTLVR